MRAGRRGALENYLSARTNQFQCAYETVRAARAIDDAIEAGRQPFFKFDLKSICGENLELGAMMAANHRRQSFRLKDKVHIQDLDGVGLITPEIEAGLSEALRARLAEVRSTE